MADNGFSEVTARLVTELQVSLAGYGGLVVSRRHFKPGKLPTFTRYAIIVSPASRPWDERRLTVSSVQYTFRIDLYLLVVNWDETDDPLFGVTPGRFGLFQMIQDVKDLLRASNLGGLLDKTYDEPAGDPQRLGGGGVEFQELASTGFDSAEYTFVHRVRLPYVARLQPECHDRSATVQ